MKPRIQHDYSRFKSYAASWSLWLPMLRLESPRNRDARKDPTLSGTHTHTHTHTHTPLAKVYLS